MERTARQDSAAAASERTGIRVPPPVFYVAGFLGGVALDIAFPVTSPPLIVAVPVAVAGLLVWLALDGAAMVRFRAAETPPEPWKPSAALVTSGPYRLTRNPMYLGMAALYAGLAVLLGVIWALPLLLVVLAVIDRYAIAREERYLEGRFGEQYREYRRRVRRWI